MLTQLKKRGFRYLAIKFFSLAFQQMRAAIFSISIPSGKGLRVGKNISWLKDNVSSIKLGSGVHLHDGIELWSVMDKITDKASVLNIGNSCQIKANAIIKVKSGEVQIGNNVAVGHRSEILCDHERIIIGNGVRIAAEAFISTGNHNFADKQIPIHRQGFFYKPVTIEDDVWIGRRVMILPGVKIGKGAIIAAGAVVTRNLEPYSIYAGIPARKVKDR